MANLFELRYGGEKYKLPEDQRDALLAVGDTTDTLKLDLGDGKSLTIVVGPGIPIAIYEHPAPRPPRVGGFA